MFVFCFFTMHLSKLKSYSTSLLFISTITLLNCGKHRPIQIMWFQMLIRFWLTSVSLFSLEILHDYEADYGHVDDLNVYGNIWWTKQGSTVCFSLMLKMNTEDCILSEILSKNVFQSVACIDFIDFINVVISALLCHLSTLAA